MRAALVLILLLSAPALATAPQPAPATDDLIVIFASDSDLKAALARVPNASPLTIVPGIVVFDAPAALRCELADLPGVTRIQRAEPLEHHTHLDLRLTRAQEGEDGLGPLPFTGRGVTVAVLDSGIDATHPDLRGRVKANVRLDDGRFLDAPGDLTGHGTHVAGIVAADGTTSDGGHRGVAPAASLVGVDISSRFTTASALLAYDWLFIHRERHGIDVVVNAWGRAGARLAYDPDDAVMRAVDRLVDQGVVVLFSASNHGPAKSTLSIEAQHPRVITVGSTDAAAILVEHSSRGPARTADGEASWIKPDVVAPGEAVTSLRSLQSPPEPMTDEGPFHRTLSGTSQAVPHVAGIVALMLEAEPTLTPAAVQNALRQGAVDLAGPGPDDATGFGLVDARDSILLALGRAPDRHNVLVAGGEEHHHDTHDIRPAAPDGIISLVRGGAPDLWTMRFPVKPGADVVAFDVSWSPGAAPLSIYLEKDGRVLGPWTHSEPTADGGMAIRGRFESPMPGMWTMHVRGATPLALEATADVTVTLQANATRAQQWDERYRLPEEANGGASTLLHGFEVLLVEARLFARAHPMGLPAFGLVLVGMLALVTPRRGRRR